MTKDDQEALERLLPGQPNPDQFSAGFRAACAHKDPTIENLLVMVEKCAESGERAMRLLEREYRGRDILIKGLEDIGSGSFENYIKLAWTAISDYWKSKKEPL